RARPRARRPWPWSSRNRNRPAPEPWSRRAARWPASATPPTARRSARDHRRPRGARARPPWPSARAAPSPPTPPPPPAPRPPRQPRAARVDADPRRLVAPDLNAAEAGVVERLGGHDDERRGVAIGRQRDLALFPELREVVAPRLLQAGEEEIGSTEQQHFGERRVALGERREVLVDDGLEEARDDLLDRYAGLDQRVGVGLGEDAALAADLVEAHARVRHRGQALAGHLELARCLLDERAGAAAARRLHEDLLRPAGRVRGQEDRLHVLAADLGDEAHVGVQTLDAGGHRDDLLDELGANQRGQAAGARAREEDTVARRKARFHLHPTEKLQHLL